MGSSLTEELRTDLTRIRDTVNTAMWSLNWETAEPVILLALTQLEALASKTPPPSLNVAIASPAARDVGAYIALYIRALEAWIALEHATALAREHQHIGRNPTVACRSLVSKAAAALDNALGMDCGTPW